MPTHSSDEVTAVLAHHDAAIQNMGGRLTGLESSVRTMQGEMHSGFSSLNTTLGGLASKLDKLDAAPKFDLHKTVSTVTTVAVLFSMVVAGIIFVVKGQFGEMVAEQRIMNTTVKERIEDHQRAIDAVTERMGWVGKVEKR